ncbi:Uncharacterised protein [Kluyvera intermedia]|nr:Uncharacterised protein [Kluyvera intermedia]
MDDLNTFHNLICYMFFILIYLNYLLFIPLKLTLIIF